MKMYKIEYVDSWGEHHKEYWETYEKAIQRIAELDTECDKMNCFGYTLYELHIKQ